MNYTNLVRDVKRFMEDDGTEFSDAIDTFIDITELKLSRELRIPAFRRRATSALTANDPFISMPSDMVSLENLHLIESNSRTLLQLRSDEFMMEYWPDRTATGSPRYYAYFDDDTMYELTMVTEVGEPLGHARCQPDWIDSKLVATGRQLHNVGFVAPQLFPENGILIHLRAVSRHG